MKSPLTIAKVVSTPTLSSWSQAYNAGNIAAVLSLEQKPIEVNEGADEFEQELSLAALGKEVLSTLEAEYFTLETKTLQSIRQAIEATVEKIPEAIGVSLATTVLINNVLYLYLYGPGRILMKRQGKLGILLDQSQENKLSSGSGFIEQGDIVILETASFVTLVPNDLLVPALETGSLTDFIDALSPALHNHGRGDAAALAFSYHEDEPSSTKISEKPIAQDTSSNAYEEQEPTDEQTYAAPNLPDEEAVNILDSSKKNNREEGQESYPIEQENFVPVVSFERRKKGGFSHKRKLLLSIAIIILIVFAASIYVAVSKQKQSQLANSYNAIISPAQEKYTEGQGLLSVNQSLARQDFQQAHDMLQGAETKFPTGSKEQQGVEDLQKKITDALGSVAVVNQTSTKQVETSTSTLLMIVAQHPEASAYTQDDKTIYLATSDGIISVAKTDQKTRTLIKNGNDWKSVGGLDTYLGNFYVLDKQGGILKYVPSGSGYVKSTYFTSNVSPDLSKATSMTIDGSIWIITSDGQLLKYTKGKQDSLSISGLDKPLKNPTQIATSADDANIYILDKGNSRLVVLDKNGNYTSQYGADILQTAKAMDVNEKNKTIYVLNNNTVYEIDLK